LTFCRVRATQRLGAPQKKDLKHFAGMVQMDRTGRTWMMSTQRRETRVTLAMKIRRMVARLGSIVLGGQNRLSELNADSSPSLPVRRLAQDVERQTAPPETPDRAATNSLQRNDSNQQAARLAVVCLRLDSPLEWSGPFGQQFRSFPDLSVIHFPAMNSRIRRTLPWAPAAERRRTERYDGKRDLHFQHAA
jgi:hypothetical protein